MRKSRIAKATRLSIAWALWGLATQAMALSAVDLYAKVSTSVWKVVVFDEANKPFAIGSAVVVAPEIMVTNCHVINKARRVQVRREMSTLEAEVDLRDDERDLCQLKVAGLLTPAVPLRETYRVQVGQVVYAIGNPRGLDLTLSSGLVSAIRRDDDGSVRYIQTSAAISGGSSGGGLFDEDGRLLGLTTSGMRDGQNLNFAIPADWIKELWSRNRRKYPQVPDPVPPMAVATAQPEAARPTAPTSSVAPPVALPPKPTPGTAAPLPAPAPKPAPAPPPGPIVAMAPAQPPKVLSPPLALPPAQSSRQAGSALMQGDEIEYTVVDDFTGQRQIAVYRVDDVSEQQVRFNAGGRVESREGRVLAIASVIGADMDYYSPPNGWVEPSNAGQAKWSSSFSRMDGPAITRFDFDATAAGEELVKTSAGEYQTVVVSYTGWVTKAGVTGTSMTWRLKVRVWYSPLLRRVVRFQSDVRPSTHGVYQNTSSKQTIELSRLRLP